MFDYVRISLAVPRLCVGSVKKNLEDILSKIEKAYTAGADYIVFPELCLTSYTCADLFFQSSLQNEVEEALEKSHRSPKKTTLLSLQGLL